MKDQSKVAATVAWTVAACGKNAWKKKKKKKKTKQNKTKRRNAPQPKHNAIQILPKTKDR